MLLQLPTLTVTVYVLLDRYDHTVDLRPAVPTPKGPSEPRQGWEREAEKPSQDEGQAETATPVVKPSSAQSTPRDVGDVDLTAAEERRGMAIFQHLDTDGTGRLDFSGLGSLLSDADRAALLKAINEDGNHRVGGMEWLRYLKAAKATNMERFGEFLTFLECHSPASSPRPESPRTESPRIPNRTHWHQR